MWHKNVRYRIYPSLLDAHEGYLRSEEIWSAYWGWSENPPHTAEEFEQMKLQELLDKINRVEGEISPAALQGTALNALIDRLVCGVTDPRCEFIPVYNEQVIKEGEFPQRDMVAEELIGYKAHVMDRGSEGDFFFPTELTERLTEIYKPLEAIPQTYLERVLPTRYGDVLLYGYADYILPDSVHDLKTTIRYAVGKYKWGTQHLVYPYCIDATRAQRFDYDVCVKGIRDQWDVFQETYYFTPERDILILTEKVEAFITFLLEHFDEITDERIFNLQ
ncbi:MAG: HNH endonuclease [Bacteroidaceae bacterium]|nr:HNH endonuclease [Bacteroidaceae bacterium]